MTTAKEVTEKLNTYVGNVREAKPVEVNVRGKIYQACQYLDIHNELSLYIIGHELWNTFVQKGPYRFISLDHMWFLAAHMTGTIKPEYAQYHPFGQNVILKKIDRSMAQAIQLSEKERHIEIVEV